MYEYDRDNVPLTYGIVFLIYYVLYWIISKGVALAGLFGMLLLLVSFIGLLLLPVGMALLLDDVMDIDDHGASWWGFLLVPCCWWSMVINGDDYSYHTFRVILLLICLAFLLIGIFLEVIHSAEVKTTEQKRKLEAEEQKRKAEYEWEHGGREEYERKEALRLEREAKERKVREEREREAREKARIRKENEERKRQEYKHKAAISTPWGTGIYCHYCGSDHVKIVDTYQCDYLGREYDRGSNCSGCRANGCTSTVYRCDICGVRWQSNPDIY
ncbi:MAG: hypothetical protein LBN22_00860 [Clostridiales Family XIII bacterium]|jgi:hypothetical protein|nr:hypothetical protein [Clostridiales Family XIII bacterium]